MAISEGGNRAAAISSTCCSCPSESFIGQSVGVGLVKGFRKIVVAVTGGKPETGFPSVVLIEVCRPADAEPVLLVFDQQQLGMTGIDTDIGGNIGRKKQQVELMPFHRMVEQQRKVPYLGFIGQEEERPQAVLRHAEGCYPHISLPDGT